MNKLPLDSVVEAMLIGTGEAVSLDQMRRAIVDVGEVEGGVAKLNKRIAQVIGKLQAACDGRPVELKETAAGFRYVTRTDYAPFISSLKGQKPPTYSRATLETLAVIAWRQPVTRGDIEQIRGVRLSSSILRALLDRDWIRVSGHKETPGRPALYATTRAFLDNFGLKSLDDLPDADELLTDRVQEALLE
ncbi:MAG: SMC-Scp complex subunit ScpB [Gammaproteobacteria bacterium]|nr:SMC-Scp complex subunit ScpB [Gammaproteobacteria bacterium]MCY4278103.1 SMC-Scp complex subunit ScpB [Gammaproteobacteria bacterium]